ncbi:MAG: hypothetical protein LQ342_000447 [Letrouitia transgressa]|nr:MAG: hypothetical protein LQ342_000447 [Letrouitia transgressa]
MNLPSQSAVANDNSSSKRPRDSRLIHMILANLGVSNYQERVPLQLMDFAYRYTSSTLQDALHLTSEGYGTSASGTAAGKANSNNDMSAITIQSLRLSIASRTHYQFNPTQPKEFYHEIAQERNRVVLPPIARDWGIRLPPEQFCFTGAGWRLKDEWHDVAEHGDTVERREEDESLDRMQDDEGEGEGGEEGNDAMDSFFGNDMNGAEEDREMEG